MKWCDMIVGRCWKHLPTNQNDIQGIEMTAQSLSQARLKELLHYNHDTGIFTWKSCVGRWGHIQAGTEAGTLNGKGYRSIKIDGTWYLGHRLVFLYVTGSFPINDVDHGDHVRNNNKWSNISNATQRENSKNQSKSKSNKSGVTGVHWNKSRKKWIAQIRAENGKILHLGSFDDLTIAASVRKNADIKYNYHSNHGDKE